MLLLLLLRKRTVVYDAHRGHAKIGGRLREFLLASGALHECAARGGDGEGYQLSRAQGYAHRLPLPRQAETGDSGAMHAMPRASGFGHDAQCCNEVRTHSGAQRPAAEANI